jgi:hypothetical protein
VLLETDHTLALLSLEDCHNPASIYSLGDFSCGVIYFIVAILKLALCTCPEIWPLHNLQHVSSILDSSSKDTKIEILNYLQFVSQFHKIHCCFLSRNCHRTCYKNINCQRPLYIDGQTELLQPKLLQYWLWKEPVTRQLQDVHIYELTN